jgi:hypothetical protein
VIVAVAARLLISKESPSAVGSPVGVIGLAHAVHAATHVPNLTRDIS